MTTKKKSAPKGSTKATTKPSPKPAPKPAKKTAKLSSKPVSKPKAKAASKATSKTTSKAATKPAAKSSAKSKAAPKAAAKPTAKKAAKKAAKPTSPKPTKRAAAAKPAPESTERLKLVPAPTTNRSTHTIRPPEPNFDDDTDEDLLDDANTITDDSATADEEFEDDADSSSDTAEEAPEDGFDYSHVHTPGESTADRRRGQSLPFAIEAARLLSDDKCDNVLLLDTRELSSLTDFIVIGTGTSDRQMRSVLDHVEDLGAETGHKPYGVNADQRATWLLADFVDVVVHLFEPNTRAHYDLESKWAEAPRLAWERPAGASSPKPTKGTIKPSPTSSSSTPQHSDA